MDKFTVPSMDWLTPSDINKRFKIFMQKCSLIFHGPLLHRPEGQKARLLLLWAGDKGLEIYNTATWNDEANQFKLGPIFVFDAGLSVHPSFPYLGGSPDGKVLMIHLQIVNMVYLKLSALFQKGVRH